MSKTKIAKIAGLSAVVLYVYMQLMNEAPSLPGTVIFTALVICLAFLIVFDDKTVLHILGFVAEVCPQCKIARTVQVQRGGLANTIFGQPLGQGRLLGFKGTCQTCATAFEVNAMDFIAFEETPTAFAPIAKTNPKLDPGNESALATFNRLALIRAEFLQSSQADAENDSTRRAENRGLAPLLGSILPSIGPSRFILGSAFDGSPTVDFLTFFAAALTCGVPIWLGLKFPDIPLWVHVDVFGLGLAATLLVFATIPRRYFRKELEPALAQRLAPLRPTAVELDWCIRSLNIYGERIGKYLDTQELLKQLSVIPPTPYRPRAAPVVATVPIPQVVAMPVAPPPADPDARGRCPNCDTEIPLASLECPNPHCKAMFAPGSAWKIQPV